MTLPRIFSALILLSAWLAVPSCINDNEPTYQDILGRSIRDRHERGGTSSGGSSSGGTGGAAATGGTAPNSGGAPDGEGGMDGGRDGESGAPGGGSGGTTVNPPPHPDFSPACFLTPTQSGEEIMKGTPCTPEDPQLCYRPCGPNQIGWKTETCLAGVYAEGDCTFPMDQDYSCYSIPADIDEAACGLTSPPQATDPCTAPTCMACNFEGFYRDTGSDVKEGFCVCREPDADGVRRWTCASMTAWPCPFSQGC